MISRHKPWRRFQLVRIVDPRDDQGINRYQRPSTSLKRRYGTLDNHTPTLDAANKLQCVRYRHLSARIQSLPNGSAHVILEADAD